MNQPSKSAFVQISEIASANALSEPFALPADVISRFEQSGIQPDEIEKIIGSRQELFQLVEEHARLSPDQSERAARLAKIVRLAEHVFGNGEKAFIWLRYPNSELGGKRPLECLARESSADLVEEALIRIDHGIFA